MQYLYTVVVVMITTCLHSGEGAYKCSPDFQNNIADLIWKVHGIPKNILRTGDDAGKEFVILTTAGYYPEGTNCIYTEFGEKGSSITLTTVTGSVRTPVVDPLKEYDGIVEEKDTKVKRVHIYSVDDIVAWYKCKDEAEQGPIEVAVKVKHGSYDEQKVTFVKNLIEDNLHVKLTDKYPHDCGLPTRDGNKQR